MLTDSEPRILARKGARSRADVPPDVLAGLNDGTLETVNLVEWLAMDQTVLLDAVLPELNLPNAAPLRAVARELADQGIMARISGIGTAFFELLAGHAQRDKVFMSMSCHRSDTVRQWAAYAILANPELTLADRLAACRPFATDDNMGVREIAWMVFRPHLSDHLETGLKMLSEWALDGDGNRRRFASEASRPRGVWCAHLAALKANPELGRAVLEPLRNDTCRYVQTSVGNWLNDAGKTRPDWLVAIVAEWIESSPTPQTGWIAHHGTRTLRKHGMLPEVLARKIDWLKQARGRRAGK